MLKTSPSPLSMDVLARDGQVLRLTVHQTDAGHVELDNLLEVAEVLRVGSLVLVRAYSVHGFLASADDHNTVVLNAESDMVIEGDWMTTIGDWLQMLAEGLTAAERAGA